MVFGIDAQGINRKKPCIELYESCQAVLRYFFAKSEFYEINEIIKHKKKTPESPIKQGFQAFLCVLGAFWCFRSCTNNFYFRTVNRVFSPSLEAVADRAKPQRLPLVDDLQAVFVACTCNLRLQDLKVVLDYFQSVPTCFFYCFQA